MKAIRNFFIGLLGGTIFGVLFAPRKGKELRNKIKSARDKGECGCGVIKDDLIQVGQEFLNTLQDLTGSTQVQDALSKGKSKFYEVTGLTSDDIDELVQEAKIQTDKLAALAKKLKEDVMDQGKDLPKHIKKVKSKAKKIASSIKKKINEK